MNNSSGITYLKPVHKTSSKPSSDVHDLAQKLSSIAFSEFSILLQSLFDGIDDSFFELANSARTNNEQNRFFEAMREIRIKRKGIESQFLRAIEVNFNPEQLASGLERAKPDDSSKDSGGITLAQQGELEEEVAIHAMTAKAQTVFQSPLGHFDSQLSSICGLENTPAYSSPLNPHKLCVAFAQACAPLEIAIKERLIVLKQFDRFVMSKLDQIVTPCNQVLLQVAVNPRPRIPTLHQSVTNPQRTASDLKEQNQADSSFQSDDTPLKLHSLLDSVRQAHSKQRSESTHKASGLMESKLNSSELLTILGKLQSQHAQIPNLGSDSKALNIRTTIAKALQNKNTEYMLQQTDEDLINLVAMLFEFILDDYNLSAPVQALLGHLQIPILRVVIKDKQFFSSSRHPARQLLNTLAKAGIGYVESSSTDKDKLYREIYKAVEKVLINFNGDIELFERVNQEFNVLVEKENRKARLTEHRTQKSEEGRARSIQAQQKVESVLSNKILNTHHPIPSIIIDVLKNGWARVMFLAYLKDEQEHQWRNSVKIVEDLIWCAQPLVEQSDRQKWIKTVPKLLKELKSGLEIVSYKTSSLDLLIKDIQKTLTEIYKTGQVTESTEAHKTAPQKPTAIPKAPTKDPLNHQAQELLNQLQIGQWFEVSLDSGGKTRCKLSAHIPEADCYIFVNRMGLKSIERTGQELAADLSDKKMIALSQGQIIDRAMNAVMSSLRLK